MAHAFCCIKTEKMPSDLSLGRDGFDQSEGEKLKTGKMRGLQLAQSRRIPGMTRTETVEMWLQNAGPRTST